MTDSSLGVLLWNQATTWADYEASGRRIEALGYDHLWAWDHLYAIFGDPYQPIFEGYLTLAAMAKVTTRLRLGLLVGANTFRSPARRREVADDARPPQRRPGDRRARRRLVRDGARGRPGSTSGPASGSGSTGWTRRAAPSGRCSTARP